MRASNLIHENPHLGNEILSDWGKIAGEEHMGKIYKVLSAIDAGNK